jgi:hypothetical protein
MYLSNIKANQPVETLPLKGHWKYLAGRWMTKKSFHGSLNSAKEWKRVLLVFMKQCL